MLLSSPNSPAVTLQRVHEKNGPLIIMVQYSKYLANIIEIFTTEFSTHCYIVCKNSWTFNVKIVYYYMFSITCPKQVSVTTWTHARSQLSPMKQRDYSSIVVTFFWRRTLIKTRWLYCVECPRYSTRRRSASNIHRSGMLRKNR